jgi:4a-hydroxytetrahydrobiopterin dehydratase
LAVALDEEVCVPCRRGTPPLPADEAARLLADLGDGWTLNVAGHLERDFRFKGFVAALTFANAVGAEAEREGHHPELGVGWGHCRVELWTHVAGGLTRNDFVLAAKASRIYAARSGGA